MTKKYTLIFFLLSIIKNIITLNKDFALLESNQQQIIDNACNKINPIFCEISKAITNIFISVREEIISDDREYYSTMLFVNYNEVRPRDIICNNIETINDNDVIYKIIFNKCSIITEGKLSIKFNDNVKHDFGIFLSELLFNSISFYYDKKDIRGTLNVTFEYNDTNYFNYDDSDGIFKIEDYELNIRDQMDIYMGEIFNNCIKRIENHLIVEKGNERYLKDILFYFEKHFSFIKGPSIYSKNKSVTYIGYNDFIHENYLHINKKIFINKLNISFEYALNNNITYNEGYFVVNNITLEENLKYNNSYGLISNKKADFEDFLTKDNSDAIWNTIFNDFKQKLMI